MTNNKTKKLVGIALLAALAYVISIFEFPIIPAVPFLKIDFSDIPIFFGMYVFGPLGGTIIAFIRSTLQYVSTGGDAGFPIGATASFIASLSLTLPIYLITTNNKFNLKNKIIASILATISLTIMLSLVNWLFVLPAYLAVMGFDVGSVSQYIIYALVPFNIIKGLIVSTLIFVMFSKMKPRLDRTRSEMLDKNDHKLYFEK